MAQFLGSNGLIPTKSVQEAAVRVLEAVQILMRAGSDRLDAESVVRRIADGTHCAPEGMCDP